MSLMGKLVGSSNAGPSSESAADTVVRLCDRLQNAAQLEDRIGALRSLKSISKDYRLEVGTKAMHLLVDVLHNERDSIEVLTHTLDTLLSLFEPRLADVDDTLVHRRSDVSASYSSGATSSIEEEYEEHEQDVYARKERHASANKRHEENGTESDARRVSGSKSQNDEQIGAQFAEIFASKCENVRALVELLQDYEFLVRLSGIRVLNALLRAVPRLVQDAILKFDVGVSHVMDLLSDTRDIVRDEAVLALRALAADNAPIQKIVAFDNAFDIVLDVIAAEQCADGGARVRDCIELMLSLLRGNEQNKQFFVESGFVGRLLAFFDLRTAEEQSGCDSGDADGEEDSHSMRDWSEEKRDNLLAMLAVVRTLVAPCDAPKVTRGAQQAVERGGLLRALSELLVGDGVPSDVLVGCVLTIGDAVRGAPASQNLLASLSIMPDGTLVQRSLDATAAGSISGSEDSRSLLIVLLMNIISGDQPFALRAAATFAFESVLLRNETLQHAVLDELLPRSFAAPQLTAGTLLLSGILANDTLPRKGKQQRASLATSLTGWLCSVALSYIIADDAIAKEKLLRVQIVAPDHSDQAHKPVSVTFFTQCCVVLADVRTSLLRRLGLLQLLATWLCDSPAATAAFFDQPEAVEFCVKQASITDPTEDECEMAVRAICCLILGLCMCCNDESVPRTSCRQVYDSLQSRVGFENFLQTLAALTRSQVFARASKHPFIVAWSEAEVCLDYEFTLLFSQLESEISAAVLGTMAPNANGVSDDESTSAPTRLESQHAEATQSHTQSQPQPEQIEQLRLQLAAAHAELDTARAHIAQLESTVAEAGRVSDTRATSSMDDFFREKKQLEEQLHSYAYYYNQAQNNVQQLQAELETLKAQLNERTPTAEQPITNNADTNQQYAQAELQRLQAELETCKAQLSQYTQPPPATEQTNYQYAQAQDTIQQLQTELEMCRAQLRERAEQPLTTEQPHIAHTNQQFEQLQLQQLQTELETCKAQLREYTEWQPVTEQTNYQYAQAQDTIQQLQNELETYKAQLREHTERQSTVEQLQTELEMCRTQLREYNERQNTVEHLQTELETYKAQLREHTERQSTVEHLQTELETCRTQLREYNERQDTVEHLQTELETYKAQLREYNERQSTVEQLQAELETYKAQLRERAEQSLSVELSHNTDVNQQYTQAELQRLQAELETCKAQLREYTEWQPVTEQTNYQYAQAQDTIQQLQTELETCRAQQREYDQRHDTVEQLQTELETYKAQLREYNERQNTVEQLQAELETYRVRLREYSERQDTVEHLQTELATYKAQLREYTERQGTVEQLNAELETCKAQLREYTERLLATEQTNHQYAQAQHTVQQLQTELETCRAQLREHTERLLAIEQPTTPPLDASLHERAEKLEVGVQAIDNCDAPTLLTSTPTPANAELEARIIQLEEEKATLNDDYAKQQQDLEDLLVLLADQELKLNAYTARFGEIEVEDIAEIDNDADSPRQDSATTSAADATTTANAIAVVGTQVTSDIQALPPKPSTAYGDDTVGVQAVDRPSGHPQSQSEQEKQLQANQLGNSSGSSVFSHKNETPSAEQEPVAAQHSEPQESDTYFRPVQSDKADAEHNQLVTPPLASAQYQQQLQQQQQQPEAGYSLSYSNYYNSYYAQQPQQQQQQQPQPQPQQQQQQPQQEQGSYQYQYQYQYQYHPNSYYQYATQAQPATAGQNVPSAYDSNSLQHAGANSAYAYYGDASAQYNASAGNSWNSDASSFR